MTEDTEVAVFRSPLTKEVSESAEVISEIA